MAEFRRSFKGRQGGMAPKEASFESNTDGSHFNVIDDTQKLMDGMDGGDVAGSQDSFAAFCYDSKTKELFGRSVGSCCKVGGQVFIGIFKKLLAHISKHSITKSSYK